MMRLLVCAAFPRTRAATCAGRNSYKSMLCGACGHLRARTRARGISTARASALACICVRNPAHAAHAAQACVHAGLREHMPAHLPAQTGATPHSRARVRDLSVFNLEKKMKKEALLV